MSPSLKNIVLILLLASAVEPTVAETIPSLAVDGDVIPSSKINAHIEYLEEPAGKKLSLAEVSRHDGFKRLGGKPASFGYQEGRVWLRLNVTNRSSADLDLILTETYPSLQLLTYFELDEFGNLLQQHASGKLVPAEERPIFYRAFAFPLALEVRQTKQLYLLAETSGSMQLPLRLESRSHFLKYIQEEMLGFGIYYGFIILMVIYSLFTYISIKDNRYLYYTAYIVSVFLSQFSLHGLGSQYLWSGLAHWNSISTIFLIGVTFATLSLFSLSFLEITKAQRYERSVVVAYLTLAVLLSFLALGAYGNAVIRLGGILTAAMPIVFLPVGIMAMRRKVPSAGFYVFALLCYTAGAGIYGLKDAGILPVNFLTEQGVVIGSALEIALFSIGMANIMRVLETQKRGLEIENKQNLAVARATKMLAHDVRRPLTAMKIGISLLKGSNGNAEQHTKWLNLLAREVEESTVSVDAMIADVLSMGDSSKLKKTKVSLRTFVENCVESTCRYQQGLRERIEMDLGGDHDLMIDPHKMERVLANILQNSQEVVPTPSRVWIRASKSRLASKESTMLVIGNDGPTIPKEDVAGVFDVFFTKGKAGGTGLGLAVAKQVVEAHGGTIACSSSAEIGTEFQITL